MTKRNKDIVLFPKIDNTYVIKSGNTVNYDRTGDVLSEEWNIFGWKGYRIGSYYARKDDGSGYLFLAHEAGGFDWAKQIDVNNMESAVRYSWIRAMQRLSGSHLFNEKWMGKTGQVAKKYGIRAFAGGHNEKTIFSLFDSKKKIIGRLEQDGISFVGLMAMGDRYDVFTYDEPQETKEEMLERMMLILRRK